MCFIRVALWIQSVLANQHPKASSHSNTIRIYSEYIPNMTNNMSGEICMALGVKWWNFHTTPGGRFWWRLRIFFIFYPTWRNDPLGGCTFFISTPIWGRFPVWLIFFRWVETTNQSSFWQAINFSKGFSGDVAQSQDAIVTILGMTGLQHWLLIFRDSRVLNLNLPRWHPGGHTPNWYIYFRTSVVDFCSNLK